VQREHARQWDDATGRIFDDKASARVKDTVQEIIDLYFLDGRPD